MKFKPDDDNHVTESGKEISADQGEQSCYFDDIGVNALLVL